MTSALPATLPPSLCELVIDEIERRLRDMPPVLGRKVRVLRARRTLSEREIPAVVLWEEGEIVPDPSGSGNVASISINLRLSIEGFVCANQEGTGRELGAMKAAIKAAVMRPANGALIVGESGKGIGVLSYTGADTEPRTDGLGCEATALHFLVTYPEAYGDPSKTR